MKTSKPFQRTIAAIIAICLIVMIIVSCKKDSDDNNVTIAKVPVWLQGEFISQDSVLHLKIKDDSIHTISGLEYMAHCQTILEKNGNTFQFMTMNGCTHTFTKEGLNIKYNLKIPGNPGPVQEGGEIIDFVIDGIVHIIKTIVNSVYGKNSPGLATSEDRLYVLVRYSGSNYSVSSTSFMPDGSVSDWESNWTTAEDALGSEGSGISYSNKGYIHLVKSELAEVKSYYSTDIDQGKTDNSHLASSIATWPSDPDTYGDYTYLIDGGSQKKIYIGKFYPDKNKEKVDMVRIFDSGNSIYAKGLCLADDGKLIFVTHTVENNNQNDVKSFGITCYQIDATSDNGAKNFTILYEATKSHDYPCWPMACDCDNSLLYVLVKDCNVNYNYFVAIYQMDLSDTDADWIALSDYLEANSDFEPSDLVVRDNYIYISNGTKDGTDGLKVLQLHIQPETVRNQAGAEGLNHLRDAKMDGIVWSMKRQ